MVRVDYYQNVATMGANPGNSCWAYFGVNLMSTKQTKKQVELSKLAIASVHAIVEAGTSITALMRTCATEADVIYSISTMLNSIKPVLIEKNQLQNEAEITLKVKNCVTQFIARCRNGADKIPPVWFNKDRTISFEPVSFVEYQKRTTKRKEVDNEADRIAKLADDRAKTLLEDKAELTKAQELKVKKMTDAANKKADKAATLAKQEQSRREKAESELAKQGEALKALQAKHSELQTAYEKALRQVKALEKAFSMAKVDHDAVQAIIDRA